jgi:glycerophosphoryl diester phosphodiesterase
VTRKKLSERPSRVIVAGGRDFNDYDAVENAVDVYRYATPEVVRHIEIVSGRAPGADRLGEQYADNFGFDVIPFPADWGQYGKAAGPRRNAEMAKYADVLIAFWDSKSAGTKNMIMHALQNGCEVHVYRY